MDKSWIDVASPNAMFSKAEVMKWLQVDGETLLHLIKERGFPAPRFGSAWAKSDRLTPRCRWRVGDIRAWLQAPDDLAKELGIKTTDCLTKKRWDPDRAHTEATVWKFAASKEA